MTGATAWKLVEAKADGRAAWVTTKHEFFRNPRYMKQFPFAHTLTMTYRLQDGALEVRTRIDSLSDEPMPVAIGFHPYFQLTDSPREEWRLSIAAKTHWLLDANTIPTGETQPITTLLPDPKNVAVKDVTLDDIFTDLERDAQGRATMTLKGKTQQVDVAVGPKFKTILVLSRTGGGRGGGRGGAAPGAPAGQARGAGGTGCAGSRVRRLRADGGYLERDEHGSQGTLQGAPDHSSGWIVGGELLGASERLLTPRTRRTAPPPRLLEDFHDAHTCRPGSPDLDRRCDRLCRHRRSPRNRGAARRLRQPRPSRVVAPAPSPTPRSPGRRRPSRCRGRRCTCTCAAASKTHGPGSHDYPQFMADWSKILTERGAVVDGGFHFPTAEELSGVNVIVMYKGDAGYMSADEKATLEAFLKAGRRPGQLPRHALR